MLNPFGIILGIFSVVQAIITKNVSIIKAPSQYQLLLKLILSIQNIKTEKILGSELIKCIEIVYVDRDDHKNQQLLSKNADIRIAWGGEEAVNSITTLPKSPFTEDIIYGPKYSYAIIDEESINLINTIKKNHYDKSAKSAVLLEIDGEDEYIDLMLIKILEVIKKNKYNKVTVANNKKEVEELWSARKSLSPALREIGGYKINEDIAVPISNLTKLLSSLDKISKKYNIKIVNFGHAGNGNIHVNLLFQTEEEKKSNNSKNCLDEIFNLVINLEGTLSGEHGIGIIKKQYLEKEINKETLMLMKNIKEQFDPKNILNSNKSI